MNIAILDTSICTENLGDLIIMDSVKQELQDLFPMHLNVTMPTHEKIHNISYEVIKNAEYAFVGGTNLLSSNMNKYNQWKVGLRDILRPKDILLMGVGWWQYQNKPNNYTSFLLKRLLSNSILHSVRDAYAEKQLKAIGISNVINTACPTMWKLTQEHCKFIPNNKADSVVFTLTDYNMKRDADQALVNILINNYKTVYFWVQGSKDYEYFTSLEGIQNIKIIAPNLEAYDKLLTSDIELDYVGTRLHAGIRALQKKKRTLIIGIDNRSTEKSKDFNLPVLEREDIGVGLEKFINSKFQTEIKIPIDNINLWKKQFISS